MTRRLVVGLCLIALGAVAFAQEDGIGDPTFPTLGNKGYLATNYLMKMDYNPETNLLKGDVVMSARATSALGKFSVDFTGYTISSVKLNGKPVPYERTASKLRIEPAAPLASGSPITLETVYSGKPEQGQSAALPAGLKSGFIHYKDGGVAICEPDMAHTWFPCNDHPLNKATFTVDLTCPAGYTPISNGVATRIGLNTVRFTMSKPAMTCMALLAVGKFGSMHSIGPNNISITSYIPRGSEMKYITPLQEPIKFMRFLASKIGDYPFDCYGMLMLPPDVSAANNLMSGSALETTTIPTFGPGQEASPEVLCHELSHQWMGDCVSITNWGDDIWWVEGFAQFSEWLEQEQLHGKDAYDKTVSRTFKDFSQAQHWLKPGHAKTADMFSAQTYIGGALTFAALRKNLGDDKFYSVVREFVAKNKYGNASAADWIQVATQVAGKDMKPFFDEWLYGDAIPHMP